jgi:hypothetical protein
LTSKAARGSARGGAKTREELMEAHRAARERRDAAPLGSDAFRDAAEEVARIEVGISELEEPPISAPG